MKKLTILSGFIISIFSYKTSKAQVSVDLNIHAGAPVYAAPAPIDYYYLPEAQAYYYVPARRYYYYRGNRWVNAAYLPGRRSNYYYSTRRVAVYGARPYMRHSYYRSRYVPARTNYYHTASYYYTPKHGNGHAYGHYKHGGGHGHGHH